MKSVEEPFPLDAWFKKLNAYLPATDVTDIRRAFEFAQKAHGPQTRASGQPYITHCLAVAEMLSELEMEGEVIVAGLLHDVPEDTPVTLEEVSHTFGPTVAKLVDGVTKLKHASDFKGSQTKVSHQSRKEYQRAEDLRKMFLAIGDDVRVVLIKLTDRLHNMRTLHHLRPDKRKRIARETMDIFAPLANRLGIHSIKSELEDRSFKFMYPEEYEEIFRRVQAGQANTEHYIAKIATDLKESLEESGIDAKLLWRTKHLYSIYLKMKRKDVDIDHIYDVRALRIIVRSIKDCYASLGVVHTKWRPIPGEFDDYIAVPKENGYQSLHTAVIDSKGQQFEVQVRTEDMHLQAELGIAAHWRYKDGTKSDLALNQKIAAMRHAILQAQGNDASEFIDAVKTDIIEEKVYVFTPKGDIIELPHGSTPIDFAYCIHTEVGHKCRGAKINGKLVSLDYNLHNGDKVEILTAKRGGPSRDWLNENLGYVKTSRARKKAKHWFKRQNYQESITQGRSLLDKELKRLNITLKFEDLAEVCGYKKTDDFLAALGYNDFSMHQVIRKALEIIEQNKKAVQEPDPIPPTSTPSPTPIDTVKIMGVGNLLTTFARCCAPVPGDQIIGYVTRGRGVSIHRRDCSNILRSQDRDRLIEVNWSTRDRDTYPATAIIQAYDRHGLMRDITDVIANEDINMTDVGVSVRNGLATLWITLEVTDLYQLKKVMDKIEQLPNVIEVSRKR